jgi:hypothetical protein
MAFNPFHSFRKHQKAVFAGLTIICMLTFVLASGVSGKGGDFFGEVGNWFGARNRGNDVGKLYGHRLDARELQMLRLQRRTANDYMATAIIQFAHNNLFEKVFDALSFTKERKQSELMGLRMAQQQAFQVAGAQQQFLRDWFRQQYLQKFQQYYMQLQQQEFTLASAKNTSEAERVQKLMTALQAARMQVDWLLQVPKDPLYPRDNLYFGGSTSVDGLVDFMIWRHQADELGIHLTDEDIVNAIRDETLGYLTSQDDRIILSSLSRDALNDAESIRHALGEEFRVRLAQAAMVGYDPDGIGTTPAAVTPYLLWEYYRQNRTEFSVQMLPVQISKFVSQVKAKPTDDDLKSLYEKYKDQEYAPDRDTPGFKQPREIKVQWIDFSKDAQTYRTEARNLLLSQAAACVSNPTLGMAWGAAFLKEYENTARPQAFNRKWGDPLIGKLSEPGFALDMYLYRDLQRPETIASTVALAANGNGFNAAFGLPARAFAREAKELAPYVEQEARRRAPVAAAFLGAGCTTPAALAIAGVAFAADAEDQYMPLALMNRELTRTLEDKFAETLAKSGENAFKEGLEKVRKDSGTQKGKFAAAAAEYVKKQIETHKWQHGESKRLDDYYNIGQDEGLKPLKDAYLVQFLGTDPKGKEFGDQFFRNYVAGGKEDTKLYTPKGSSVSIGDKSFLFWLTEDVPPKVLPFEVAKNKVQEAWYLKEARPLAEKAAEEIAQKARKGGNPVPELVDAAKGQPLVSLDSIARQTMDKNMRADVGTSYQAYQFPADKVEYLGKDSLEKILDLKQVGDVTVLANGPKDTYYVAAVTHRNEPTPSSSEFRDGGLLPRLEEQRRLTYRRAVLERLHARAGLEIYPEGRRLVEEKGSIPQDE